MLPEFLCIGFQKCGTTTMYDLLKQHKDIALTQDVKEPMFYRVFFVRKILGRQWYENRYFGHLDSSDPRRRGEVNAGLAMTNCADKLGKDLNPDTKLIFMMRNPADRTYSAYKYFMALGFLPCRDVRYDRKHGHAAGFDHYVHRILESSQEKSIMKARLKYLVFSQTRYTDSIQEFQNYFPREQMKFIFFEDFVKNQRQVCQDLYRFLQIEDDENVRYNLKSNEGNIKCKTPAASKIGMAFMGLYYVFFELMDLSRKLPSIYKVFENLNNKVQSYCVIPDTDTSKMLPETRSYLNEIFKKEKEQISALTGRNLTDIWV